MDPIRPIRPHFRVRPLPLTPEAVAVVHRLHAAADRALAVAQEECMRYMHDHPAVFSSSPRQPVFPSRLRPFRARPARLAAHPFPRRHTMDDWFLYAHKKEHAGVHVVGCDQCYRREYMFFRRHPELTPRYTRLGFGDEALAGRTPPLSRGRPHE